MISPKLELCLVLCLYLIAFHRVASQCQDFITVPVDTIAGLNTITCLTCDYPDRTNEEWFRDSTAILSGMEEETCNCEVSPNDGRICFENPTADDIGQYTCEIRLDFGVVCSTPPAQLTLAETPVIEKITTPIMVVADGIATIPVMVTGVPEPTVQFMRDGEILTNSSRITVGERELIIGDVDMDDRGDYSIVATNIGGEDTHARRLLVEFVPSLTVEQSDVVNNEVTLTCTSISYPQPIEGMAFWEREGEALVGEDVFTATDIDFTAVITVVVPCQPEDYRCVVVNSQGTRRSGITICNEDPPAPPLITVAVHNATAVVVTWDSVTDPVATNYTIEYRQMGGGGVYLNRTVQENTEESHSEVIGGLQQGVDYEFRAVSANRAGRGNFGTTMTLKLPTVPVDPVTGVVATETVVDNQRAISITWDDYLEPIMGYRIIYTISGVAQDSILVGSNVFNQLIQVDCNSDDIDYRFQVQAVNQFGSGTPSHPVELTVNCVIPPFPSQAVTILNVEPFGTALTVTWQVATGSTEEGLVITVRELNSNGDIKITNNYTIPRQYFVQRAKCVGKLMEKTTYEVCIVANITGRTGEEIDCFDSFVRTLEADTVDVSNCAQPTTIEVGSRLEDSSSSSGGIPDWAIAVIVVGVLAIVALVFCLMGVFFACHTSQRKGGVDFGSQSSIHTESLSSNMHIQNHRPMSPSRSCLSYHSKGHSTNWNDHVDTLRALESGVATAV